MVRFHPLVFWLLIFLVILCPSMTVGDQPIIRFATFNIAMGLNEQGELYRRLQSGDDEGLKKVAAIIQRIRPDVLLLNEFDYSESNSANLFNLHYLEIPQFGQTPISFSHTINEAVNTGQDSGLDLDQNGTLGEAADAWGFGRFPGQFGMTILSRFPLKVQRNLQLFKWVDMPGALMPLNPDGSPWYPAEIRDQLYLSSKSHRDIGVRIENRQVHFLVSHPTPPVFDGPEDRNGTRNHDEIRLWADYVDPERSAYIHGEGGTGGLEEGALFIIAGDLNADPLDGDSQNNAMAQLLEHPLVNASCVPVSTGAAAASREQGGKNLDHKGDPAADTGDFNDKYVGNMRVDYVLPSATLNVSACGVFWPAADEAGYEWMDASDHRLVWLDIRLD